MNDEPLTSELDDLHDRLIDRGLEEVLGGGGAPDLRERILAAAGVTPTATVTTPENWTSAVGPAQSKRRRIRWMAWAIAASVMAVVGTGLVLPAMQAEREAARRDVGFSSNKSTLASERQVLLERAKGRATASGAEDSTAERLSLGVPVNSEADADGRINLNAAGTTDGAASSFSLGWERQDQPAFTGAASTPTQETAGAEGGEYEVARGPQESAGVELGMRWKNDAESDGGRGGTMAGYGGRGGLGGGGDGEFGGGPRGFAGGAGGRGGARGRGGRGGSDVAQARDGSMQLDVIPFSDGPPVGYPDAPVWQELSRRRSSRYARTDLATLGSGTDDAADLEVARQMAMMQAQSSSGLDAAVSAEMDKDPTMSMYKEQLFALDQQIQQLSSASENQDNSQLNRLKVQYAQTEETMQRYRTTAEREAATRLARLLNERNARLIGDRYAEIVENAFLPISAATADNRLSTFSIDVDTASYANVRQFLMQGNRMPPPDAVRIEELVNYFDYDYATPTDETPFAANVEVAACPWAPQHRLVRVGIKGREIARTQRPKSNLVFLVDVSGSMDDPQKLPLLVEGMRMLTRELGENDRVAIVVYASTEGLALDSTRGDRQDVILAALDRLSAGGSTAGGAGIQLAYNVAAQNFIAGGVNRVILCTDGDFNVGVTNVEALQQLAADKAKDTDVFLTVLGFGRGNLNDALMEAVADHGNGNYHYVDNRGEARKVLVEEMTGTLVTIAKDVKIQIEFNPRKVAGYRLIGYENRVLAAEDFNNDAKDAGEIGAGHTVTALYEVVPAGEAVGAPATDELKYGAVGSVEGTDEAGSFVNDSDELLTLKIRFKQPDGDESTKLEFPVTDGGQAFAAASEDFQFASAVAGFGMLLRGSQHKGDATFAGMLEIAESAIGDHDSQGYRQEFVEMISQAKRLAGE